MENCASKPASGTKYLFYSILMAEPNDLTSEIVHIGVSYFDRDPRNRKAKEKQFFAYVVPEGDISQEATDHHCFSKKNSDELRLGDIKMRGVKTQKEALIHLFNYVDRVSRGHDIVLCAIDNKRYAKVLCYNMARFNVVEELEAGLLKRCFFIDALKVLQKCYPSLQYHYLPFITKCLGLPEPHDETLDAHNLALCTRFVIEKAADNHETQYEDMLENYAERIPLNNVLAEQRIVHSNTCHKQVLSALEPNQMDSRNQRITPNCKTNSATDTENMFI